MRTKYCCYNHNLFLLINNVRLNDYSKEINEGSVEERKQRMISLKAELVRKVNEHAISK